MSPIELLNKPYTVRPSLIDFYQKNGCVKLKNVLDDETISGYAPVITKKTFELNTVHLPMEDRSTYQKAFLQVTNLWQKDASIREFIFSKRLAGIAAQLMQVDSVRLYHDQALYKEPSGGYTPWHADQFYWPLKSEKCVTAWIPLQYTPVEMGALEFSMGSQHFTFGRDLPISDESESAIQNALEAKRYPLLREPFELGEVSFHAGWTFHRAGPNITETPRAVMTIIYMDAQMKLKQPDNDTQILDWEVWCPGAKVGEVIDTPLNPILWP